MKFAVHRWQQVIPFLFRCGRTDHHQRNWGSRQLDNALVNFFIQNPDGSSKLAGADYYLFFAATMAIPAVLFIPVAMWYKEKTYIQDEEDQENYVPPTNTAAAA